MSNENDCYDGRAVNAGCLAVAMFVLAVDAAFLFGIVEFFKWLVGIVTGGA